jgi:hypothetical protein
MDRRTFVAILACGVVTIPLTTNAQQARQFRRVGVLTAD